MCEARVLEIIGKRPVGGVGTVMLNYQRHMNMERVQMDYLIFGEQEEIFGGWIGSRNHLIKK